MVSAAITIFAANSAVAFTADKIFNARHQNHKKKIDNLKLNVTHIFPRPETLLTEAKNTLFYNHFVNFCHVHQA